VRLVEREEGDPRLMLMVQVSLAVRDSDEREIRIGVSVVAACTGINADSALKANTTYNTFALDE